MADTPDTIVLARHRDLHSGGYNRLARHVLLTLLGLVLVAGLLSVFGQKPSTATVTAPEATLQLHAPARLRGGLYYQARFTIDAHRKLGHAVLVLAPGWTESQTINTIEPAPVGERSHNGRLALSLGTIDANTRHTLYMQLQVNPTNVGRHDASVALYDGDTRLFDIRRTVTIYP